MDEMVVCSFELFGQNFNFTTVDGKKEEFNKIILYYKNIVNKILSKVSNRSHLEVAVLAGLKITDELYTLANSKKINLFEDENKKIDLIIDELLKHLDNSINL